MSHHYIKYTDVRFSYPESGEVLKGVSFLVTHGEKVALLGMNGAGKSTLLLTMNGLLTADSGTIDIGGIPVTRKTLPLIRQSVGMVFQNADDQLFMPTVEEDVAFGPVNMKLPRDEVETRVTRALHQTGIEHLRHRNPAQLSGGQKRMAAMATVLSMEPNILVLDEPTANLDWKAKCELISILEKFRHTCIIATHDLLLARRLCDRAIILADGKVAADTSIDRLMKDHSLLELIGIDNITEFGEAIPGDCVKPFKTFEL